MRLRNRHGTHVDPIPFVVVAGLSFMVLLSFGPLYGQALGLSLGTALALSSVLFAVAAVTAFHQQVWTARPDLQGEVAAAVRAERLFYLIPILAALVVALAVPLFAG